MVGGYRCTYGHVWAPREGNTPTVCPVCGDTVIVTAKLTAELTAEVEEPGPTPQFLYAAAPGQAVSGNSDATMPPDPIVILPPRRAEHLTRLAPANTPSFSSLVGLPGTADAFGLEAGDVLPISDETIEFASPVVPGYEIHHELGRGGMGVVYKAKQINLNRPVALKMILTGVHAGQTERERFRREAEAVATLQNPHIVQIFEIGEANGQLYLALEFVDGGSLAQRLKGTAWPAREAAELVEMIARAVHYAHGQGIVHRDLKPGNILLSAERGAEASTSSSFPRALLPSSRISFPKITDFGLAKRLGDTDNPHGTKTGAVMGTPSYIAPEQASGRTRDVGPAADVYSLGAILYELLTGRPPFTGETPIATVLQVLHEDPVAPKRLQPTIPRDLETICLKCLEKSPAKRYASADDLGDDLRRFLQGEPIQARPLSMWGRRVKWARRHPALTVLWATTFAATIAFVSVLSVAYAQVKEAVTQKEKEAEDARQARAKEATARERAEDLLLQKEAKEVEILRQTAEVKREAERTRRAAFALQLAQIAAMAERDPRRAQTLLDDNKRCPLDLRDFTWAYLHRLCQRQERLYADHGPNDPLYALAHSPTGAFVATAGRDGQTRVWDPRTGRTWAILAGHEGKVAGIAFSPDGEVLATAGADGTIQLWELPVEAFANARRLMSNSFAKDSAFLKEFLTLRLTPAVTLVDAHRGGANCLVFSPDGRMLVSGGEDGFVKWWDLSGWRTSNAVLATVGGPTAAAAIYTHAQVSPRAVRLLRDPPPTPSHRGGVMCLAFAASGRVLVSGGADREARIWEGDGSELRRTLDGFTEAVSAVAVSPDGKVVAAVANNKATPTIRLIDAETGKERRRLIGHTGFISALAVSHEGECLASAGFDWTVRLWDIDDGKERSVLHGHTQAVSSIAFAPDRHTVVSAGMDGTARVWQTTSRPTESEEAFPDFTPTVVAVSANGTAFVGGDDQGRVQIYRPDANRNRPGTLSRAPWAENDKGKGLTRSPVKAAAASPDGQTVFASADNALFIWRAVHLPGGKIGPGFPLPPKPPVVVKMALPVHAMVVSPSGRWLATLDNRGLCVWDTYSFPTTAHAGTKPVDPGQPHLVYEVAFPEEVTFHPAGNRLAVVVGNGFRIISLEGKVLANLPDAHANKVKAVAFGGQDGGLLATAGLDGLIKVWHVSETAVTLQSELTGHTGVVSSLAFSPNGRTLASGGHDRSVILWDSEGGQERNMLTGHADRILRVQFTADSSALITASRDGIVKRWRSGTPTAPLPRFAR